jgi:hypothetical protein
MPDNKYPNMIGKADERMIIIAFMVTSKILAEWRRSPVICNLDTNALRDDAKTTNRLAGIVLGLQGTPFTEEQIKTLQQSTDGLTSREADLSFSFCAFCLTGETTGEAQMVCKCMADMQQICQLINVQRAQQAQKETSTKIQAAGSLIDLSQIKGPEGFKN